MAAIRAKGGETMTLRIPEVSSRIGAIELPQERHVAHVLVRCEGVPSCAAVGRPTIVDLAEAGATEYVAEDKPTSRDWRE